MLLRAWEKHAVQAMRSYTSLMSRQKRRPGGDAVSCETDASVRRTIPKPEKMQLCSDTHLKYKSGALELDQRTPFYLENLDRALQGFTLHIESNFNLEIEMDVRERFIGSEQFSI